MWVAPLPKNLEDYEFLVPLQVRPTREELYWAWKFTVLGRAEQACQECNKAVRLDACHIKSRRQHPESAYDPKNGIALCRSCHMRRDHTNRDRPSGRPAGMKMAPEVGQKISAARQRWFSDPANREKNRQAVLRGWEGRRKRFPHSCENCGQDFIGGRFCSAACHYAFRTGKPRSGY